MKRVSTSMVLRWIVGVVLVCAQCCYAATTLQFRRIVPPSGGPEFRLLAADPLGTSGLGPGNNQIANHRDVRYSTNVTLGGKSYVVALDTGSTDLWVYPESRNSIGNFNETNIPLQLLYGDGSYGVQGTVAVASLQMGSFNVSKQAFLHVNASNIRGLHELGIDGVLGLSFDFIPASPINRVVKARDGEDADWGNSVLKNIFARNTSEPNFVALDLARSDDVTDIAGGSFSIGEYVEAWAGVAQAPKLPQYPPGGGRWTTLLEVVRVGGENVTLRSQIRGTPNGTLVALLDTGDPTAVVPVRLMNDIYARIPGAVSLTQQGETVWILPCNTTTVVEFMFGGQAFPLHPLDLSILTPVTVSGNEYTACARSIAGVDNLGGPEFDASLGDTFLRNVYSVYDFGDRRANGTVGEPFMRLLAQTNATVAVPQVAVVRERMMAGMPPEIPPAELIALLRAEAAPEASTQTNTGVETGVTCATGPGSGPRSTSSGSAASSTPTTTTTTTTAAASAATTTSASPATTNANTTRPVERREPVFLEEGPRSASDSGRERSLHDHAVIALLGAALLVGGAVLLLGVYGLVRRRTGRMGLGIPTRSGLHYLTEERSLLSFKGRGFKDSGLGGSKGLLDV